MDINERSSTPRVKTRSELYRKMTLLSFYYQQMFSKKQRKMMRYVFAKNTLGEIIKSGDIRMSRIVNFDSYKEYYVYNISKNQLEFLHKADINYILKQAKLIALKGFNYYQHLRN